MAGRRGGRGLALMVASGIIVIALLGAGRWLALLEPAAPVEPAPTPAGTRLDATTPLPIESANATTVPERLAPAAFGALPPLALPGGLGPRPAFVYERTPELGPTPMSADVYRLTWTAFTPASVRSLGQRLGLAGPVTSLGPDTFQVDDRAQGRLFVAHGRIIFTRVGTPAPGDLAPDVAIAQARQWLLERDLLPPDTGPPRVRPLPDLGVLAIVFTPRAPAGLLTDEPGLTVALDGQGVVRDLDMLWPAQQQVARYPLASLALAWEAVQRGEGFVEVEAAPSPDGRLVGRIVVTRADLGYALAGGADAMAPAYLEPVFIFSGQATLAGQVAPVPCRVYLPALAAAPALPAG